MDEVPTTNGEKTGKDPVTGRFLPGNDLGEGRPPGIKNFTTKVREALEKIADGKDYTYEEAFIKSIMKKAIVEGDPSTQRLIWNYLDGLPRQTQDVNLNLPQFLVDLIKNGTTNEQTDPNIHQEDS